MFPEETLTLVKRLINPVCFIRSFIYWTRIFGIMLLKRFETKTKTNVYRAIQYPGYIKRINKNSLYMDFERGYLKKNDLPSNGNNSKGDTPQIITIGNTGIKLSSAQMELPDWFYRFGDTEDMFFTHRWGWLLMAAVENPSKDIKNWGIKIMKDWFLKMDNNRSHPAWESYSVSERIVNALLFFYALKQYPCNNGDDIYFLESRLVDAARYLKENLEFHGELTNNHILNNARALYILGMFSSCKGLAETGRAIISEETHEMVTPSGFLREDSSGYHFIILRTYLEILWTAEHFKDTAFAERLKPVVETMVKAGWFFLIYDEKKNRFDIPLIGDISPDFPLEWLVNICFSIPALKLFNTLKENKYINAGWNRIWDSNGKPSTLTPQIEEKNKDVIFHAYENEGWYRADYHDLTIFWHIHKEGCIPLYSHGHNDILSFVLYWKGTAVIIDPGRYRYGNDVLGAYGKTAYAHNTYIINDTEPYPLTRYIYPTEFRKGKPAVSFEQKQDAFFFKIGIDGFQRLNKEFYGYREFKLTSEALEIKDIITGRGDKQIKTFFHFGEDIECIKTGEGNNTGLILHLDNSKINISIKADGVNPRIEILSGDKESMSYGWYFPDYGKAKPINTGIFHTQTSLPYSVEYGIKFSG